MNMAIEKNRITNSALNNSSKSFAFIDIFLLITVLASLEIVTTAFNARCQLTRHIRSPVTTIHYF